MTYLGGKLSGQIVTWTELRTDGFQGNTTPQHQITVKYLTLKNIFIDVLSDAKSLFTDLLSVAIGIYI